MQAKQLRKIFPKGTRMPNALAKLCDYSEQTGGATSCDFELTNYGKAGIQAWFAGNEKAADQFVIFGIDELQSLYGYWLYGGRPLIQAPIVYLNHEDTGNTVLANNIEEFLALLAMGKEEVGLVDGWEEQTEPCADIDEFRSWLKQELGITPPAEGHEIVDPARQAHPDLDAWIREQGKP